MAAPLEGVVIIMTAMITMMTMTTEAAPLTLPRHGHHLVPHLILQVMGMIMELLLLLLMLLLLLLSILKPMPHMELPHQLVVAITEDR